MSQSQSHSRPAITHSTSVTARVLPSNAAHTEYLPQATSGETPITHNKPTPRDYVNPRLTTTTPTSARLPSKASPLLGAGTGPRHAARGSSPTSLLSKTSEQEPLQPDSGEASDKENLGLDDDLKVARTRSPESIASTAFSVAGSVASNRPSVLNANPRPTTNNMPRTSSIDSAISSVSNASAQPKSTGEPRDLSPTSVRNLMATAGSAENLVAHLLKEKNNAAHQNNQLWKLVEKQRALLLGLNKDLERVTKERDKYKKKLKELTAHDSQDKATTQFSDPPAPQDSSHSLNPQGSSYPPASTSHAVSDRGVSDGANGQSDASRPTIIVSGESQDPSEKARRPTLQAQTTGFAQPTFSLTEATPLAEKPLKGFSASRKITPAPLNLARSNGPPKQTLMNQADRARLLADDEEDEIAAEDVPRGRRKTREEDDRDREEAVVRESEARSRSKKDKAVKAPLSEGTQHSIFPAPQTTISALPASPRPPNLTLGKATLLNANLAAPPLKSPGLPASPRPMNNTPHFAALPTSPRANIMPLSPRAPKQPIPAPMMSPSPFADPATIQRQNIMTKPLVGQADRLQVHEPTSSSDIPPVYKGLSSPAYPNLLLPPNAIPSIQVKVAFSRLRPSRHSMLGLKTQEDATVFSLSVFSRASRNELWRVEKIPAALPLLEQQLKPFCRDLPRLPDRKIFNGHSPAVIDARRSAVDDYFEDLLDLEMDEKAALIICKFLSDDVQDPEDKAAKMSGAHQELSPLSTNVSGKAVKTGFLTKRGKNFGGWKSRYFILDSPELRYYETPGGPHLGTIKLQHARIGSQRADDATNVDADDQYRHAFLIQEPKKKDSNAYVRHVLCAESDVERDEWVTALLYYTEDGSVNEAQPGLSHPQNATQPPSTYHHSRQTAGKDSAGSSPSSPSVSSHTTESPITEPVKNAAISRPMNGAPIADSSQWGNKSANLVGASKDKSKTGFFHFKKSSSEHLQQTAKQQEQASKPRILRHNGYVRAVFGLPLSEAVEYCAPFDVETGLPAVVYRCIEYLKYRNAANEEGLFRLSGSNILIKNLKERFNVEGDVDLVHEDEYYDVHAVASLLKTYLRELPSSILTRDLHIEFLRVLDLTEQTDKILAFNILVHRLPQPNFDLIRALSQYLLEVTENSAKNKMSARNVGIVFSPTLNIPTPVFDLFLREFHAIFDQKPGSTPASREGNKQLQSTAVNLPSNQNLTAEEIRSPRHQMFSDLPTPAYNQANFSKETTEPVSQHVHNSSSGSGEFGFTPLHPSYETGNYMSNTQQDVIPRYGAVVPIQNHHGAQHAQVGDNEVYGSLNNMLVPKEAVSAKAKRRESAMLF